MTFAHLAMNQEDIIKIKAELDMPRSICLITHRNPDGDALGSSLAMKHFLEKFNQQVKVILPSEYPLNYAFMAGIDECHVYDLNQEECLSIIDKSDMIFCLDFNSLDRIDKIGLNVQESKAIKILIDHHLDPEPFADFVLSETSASSTCELVHKFIYLLGEEKKIDVTIAESILTGLITDTGSFKYNTNAYTYQVASDLKQRGVDDYGLQDKIYNCLSEKQLKLLGHSLANRMEIIPEYGAGIIALTKKDYIDYDIQRGDTEGIVNYLLMIKGIEVAAFIREQPTIVKLSLRSKGDISVQEIARNHFNGGGHKNASGGAAYAKLEDIVARFKNVLPKYVKRREL